MADCRYILRFGVRGDRALDLMKELMLSAGIWRQKSTGYVSPGDLRRDADGEVVADLCRPYWLDFSPVSLKPEDFIAIDAAKARVRDSLAERMRQTVRDRLWGSSPAGFLRKSLCLIDGAGKAVEQKTVFAIFFLQSVFHDFAGNVVGDELPFIDIRFGKQPYLRLIFDVRTENVACGNMRHSETAGNSRRLRAFARAGRSE